MNSDACGGERLHSRARRPLPGTRSGDRTGRCPPAAGAAAELRFRRPAGPGAGAWPPSRGGPWPGPCAPFPTGR